MRRRWPLSTCMLIVCLAAIVLSYTRIISWDETMKCVYVETGVARLSMVWFPKTKFGSVELMLSYGGPLRRSR